MYKINDVVGRFNNLIIKDISSKEFDFNTVKSFIVQCQDCGREYNFTSSEFNNKICDCKKEEYHLNKYKDYLGKKINKFTIQEIYLKKNRCYCKALCECGNVIECNIGVMIKGQRQGCKKCSLNLKGLDKGREITSKAKEFQTNVMLFERKNINKNSSTGYNGISKTKYGYRAYINFKRKQYHLGVYSNIEDAISARKEAEENIYGSFIEWYNQTHTQT